MTVLQDLPGTDQGEVAVIGLARSGRAAAALLRKDGYRIYASDISASSDCAGCADELRRLGIDADVGRHDLERIARSSLVVVSPGVPPDAPPVRLARSKGVRVISEVEAALHYLPAARIIAVTGTNGKSTTTALIAHILSRLTGDAEAAGNIGTALAEVAGRATPPAWIALEMSSFQLHDTASLKPAVGVLTNLSPDHLDRYPNVEAYYADKARLFVHADDRAIWVTNADDPQVQQMVVAVPGGKHRFSLRHDVDAFHRPLDDQLVLFGEPLLERKDFPLLGRHNVANALAAALAVAAADPAHRDAEARRGIQDALKTFRSLPHRLELVGEFAGVQWINDSKATNISSTAVAIDGMERPTVLLLGGRHKGEAYSPLREAMRKKVKKVIAYGEAAPIIERDLAGATPLERVGSDFAAAVNAARAVAQPGDAVLLSPACSSYDMFANYEERGEAFRALAEGRG